MVARVWDATTNLPWLIAGAVNTFFFKFILVCTVVLLFPHLLHHNDAGRLGTRRPWDAFDSRTNPHSVPHFRGRCHFSFGDGSGECGSIRFTAWLQRRSCVYFSQCPQGYIRAIMTAGASLADFWVALNWFFSRSSACGSGNLVRLFSRDPLQPNHFRRRRRGRRIGCRRGGGGVGRQRGRRKRS